MLHSTLLVTLAGLAAATDSVYFSTAKADKKGLPLLSGFTPRPQFLSMAAASCEGSTKPCGNTCIESSGECCSTVSGTYCEDGYRCQATGCCEDGKLCSGAPSGCTKGKEMCGQYCIPEGKVCCLSGYCDEGEKCTSDGKCTTGGSSGGSSGSSGGSSGGSGSCSSFEESCGDGCMPKGMVCCDSGYCLSGQTCTSDGKCRYGSGGSSGGSSSGSCASYQEACGDACMPKGMVCCGKRYCLTGQTCSSDGTCRYSSSGGSSGGSSDDDDDDDKPTFTQESATRTFDSPSFTAPSIEPVPTIGDDDTFPTFSSRPIASGVRAGGDDGDSSGSSSGSSNGDGGSNSGSIVLPGLFMGAIALIPLFL
ncbi:hypothetical protein FLAG1_05565 [Fusarium langsethiae]|uniref:GPI anchored protein n=1 Tax=Fusarium langsethiae TaxID=179993 RepID=A0A0N0DES3_FUSLA|nr:hypothetical protein FLAG1_05565 [Fusarium langsethiae]GKU03234.1 unnamed protein product [Fusarium langsethiae]GKU18645.1 unnamed protein product [Fusarium langsethiae]